MYVLKRDQQCSVAFTSNRLEIEFELEPSNALWVTMRENQEGGLPTFSLPLVRDIYALIRAFKENGGCWPGSAGATPVHYAVLRSSHPAYFSLGGDLSYFQNCIRQRDRAALYAYSSLCLDVTYDWSLLSNHGITTIALVQGRALGGGFEAALAADFLIAEEHSEFSLPEIKFGLFPCSGAMSLLARKVGAHRAEEMMTNNRVYSAAELKEMGIVSEICPRGEGEDAARGFMAKHSMRREPRVLLQRSRNRVAPLNYEELRTVVKEWVDLAMKLGEDELKVMGVLVNLQKGWRSHSPSS